MSQVVPSISRHNPHPLVVRNRRITTLSPIWDDDQYSPYWDEPCDDDESSCDEDLEHQINDVTDDVIDDDIDLDYDVVWE